MLEWLQVEHVDCDHYCNTLYLGGGGGGRLTTPVLGWLQIWSCRYRKIVNFHDCYTGGWFHNLNAGMATNQVRFRTYITVTTVTVTV